MEEIVWLEVVVEFSSSSYVVQGKVRRLDLKGADPSPGPGCHGFFHAPTIRLRQNVNNCCRSNFDSIETDRMVKMLEQLTAEADLQRVSLHEGGK